MIHRAIPLLLVLLAVDLRAQEVVVPGEGVEDLGRVLVVADLDGDRKAEVICGAPRHATGTRHLQGRVLIVQGGDLEGDDGEAGIPEGRLVSWRGSVAGDLLGTSIAVGDVNGDRRPDLLMGAPGRSRARGAAFLLLGGKGGGSILSGGMAASADFTFLGDHLLGALGRSLVLGDLDGDGLDEMIIAEPMVELKGRPQAGRVLVFRGRKRFKGEKGTVGQEIEPDLVIEGRAREGAGSRMLCADLDGDGVEDLVLASPFHDAERGIVTVVRGRRGLLGKARTLTLGRDPAGLVVRGYKNARFGEAVCAMDLDDDGRAELLASEPKRNHRSTEQAGAIHAVSHDPEARVLDLGRLRELRSVATLRGLVAFEQLGTSMHAGRIAGEAPADLVVGSPAVGRVVVYVDPPAFDPPPRPARAFMPGGSGMKGFGQSVGAGDLDGDGKAEIVIAAPGANKILVYRL